MTTFLVIFIYAIGALIVGKLSANIFLNGAYRRELEKMYSFEIFNEPNRYLTKCYPTYEDYVLNFKQRALIYAEEDSDIDRSFAATIGGAMWPLTIIVIVGYYLHRVAHNISFMERFAFSAAARDVRKTEKNISAIKQSRELENEKIQEWNQMVDILNENGLNDITKYEKRKEN